MESLLDNIQVYALEKGLQAEVHENASKSNTSRSEFTILGLATSDLVQIIKNKFTYKIELIRAIYVSCCVPLYEFSTTKLAAVWFFAAVDLSVPVQR